MTSKKSKSFLPIISFWLYYSAVVSAQILAPPALVSPENGSANLAPPVTLVWDQPTAVSFRVQVSTDAAFNNVVIDVSGITATEYELTHSLRTPFSTGV